jgi:hypothetical protein
MSEIDLAGNARGDGDATTEMDEEVDEVLTALRRLRDRVVSPVVRACLEAARADIIHLTSSEDPAEAEQPRRAAG